jgi:predicted  nucleic acid-binding Zn-ribbon protein
MAQQIKKKFIRNDAVDGTKIKLLSGQSLRIESPSGEVELLKLGSQGEVLSKGQEIAFKSQVDELRSDLEFEESARIAADQSLQSQIDNIISNVDPAALDSLTEIVQAFQSADEDLYEAITSLGTGSASAIAQEVSRAQAAEASLYSAIELEKTERMAADQFIEGLISQESSQRQAEDQMLYSAIQQESQNRQFEIQAETSRAMQAEQFIENLINTETQNRFNEDQSIRSELDATQIGAGLDINGGYVVPVMSNYLSGATSLAQADLFLDQEVWSLRIQAYTFGDTLNAVKEGAGLDITGQYLTDAFSNYLGTATSLANADHILDSKIKENFDAIVLAEGEIDQIQTELSTLDSKIETEKGRIDAILSASSADYDSFAEIVQLINSVDTENDSAFASYVLSNNEAVAELDSRLDIIEPKVSTLESEMDQAQADIDAVEARLDVIEPKVATLETEMNAVEAAISAETSRALSAESSLSSSISAETSRALAAESSISAALQSEISRATSFETSLQDQITEEILRSISVDSELESRIVELEESVESLDSQYSLLQSQVSVLQSDTNSSVVFLQSQIDTLRSDLSEEISDRIADVISAEQTLEQKIKEVGVSFKRETHLVTQQMITNGFFMLQNKAFDNSTTISIGRLFLIEDEDYQVVLEGGVSKVVFMGSILPNQDESLEVDDLIKVKYFKDSRN